MAHGRAFSPAPALGDGGRRSLGRPARRACCWVACKQRWPACSAAGIGGPRMAAQGFEAWWPHDKLAVRGYVEVLRHYREIAGIRDQLAERLLAEPPTALHRRRCARLQPRPGSRAARQPASRPIHFVCPSIWAWRGERIEKMAASCDHVLCLFPFEPALLRKRTASPPPTSATRWPTRSRSSAARAAARRRWGCATTTPVVALLPGSRRSEIQYIAPPFLQAAARAAPRSGPALRFVLPVAPGLRGAGRAAGAPRRARRAASSCSTAVRTRRWPPAT